MRNSENTDPRAPIKVGIVGFGNAGRLIHAPLLAASPDFQLVAVASSRAEAVRAALPGVAVYPDLSALLREAAPDLVIVATPPGHHAEAAQAALAAGAHVLVEKPFTVTLAEAQDLAEQARGTGRILAVFHNRRFDSCYLAVRAAIESGAIGRINHFESQYNRFDPEIMAGWRAPADAASGAWYDLGSHLVDQALQLFGLPDAIALTLASNRPDCAADDWFHAVLHYPGQHAILHASFLVAGGVPRFTVHGDKGSLVKHAADRQGHQLWAGHPPDAADHGADDDPPLLFLAGEDPRPLPTARGDYRRFYTALAAALRGQGANPTPTGETLAVMAVIEAGLVSAREGRVVPLAFSKPPASPSVPEG